MTLPVEILREMFSYLMEVATATSERPSQKLQPSLSLEEFDIPSKPSWQLIAPFSLSSRIFRAIALEGWFRTLVVKDADDLLDSCLMFPEIKTSWTRELHCIQLNSSNSWKIDDFKRLSKLRLDLRLAKGQDELFANRLFLTADRSFSSSSILELDLRGNFGRLLILLGISQSFSLD
ncbi:hypothetical protein D9758_013559 [Tetrapyrgos nigripes]|uniref:Uncharacterized protein n=1 Tax=Tetrapyrgos nigripes TaxID=182062 RepID=A0A8H5FL81_9AGAR|nr:hypothetical protein D9758_013559 [Tetrapyrgos nigripes]